MDILEHNRRAWNKQSMEGSRWATPVSDDIVERAKIGEWEVILTPNKEVPKRWFPPLPGREVLCLASGGGQQAPILAAAGARVTSFDNSDEQLAKDRLVAEHHCLDVKTIRGDMADLSVFDDDTFDLIFHPVSNVFVPDVKPVWKRCHRVLREGGVLLSGFMNPTFFLFDHVGAKKTGVLEVKYSLPFSDVESLDKFERRKILQDSIALEFGHTLEDQIGGQIEAGFAITGFYEDDWDDEATPLNRFTSLYMATKAIKIAVGSGL
ncbi:class I SAM-dependent methyltransferase [Candidatus Sumerlaeota bacterium]|nr:class I SAM-dependent methyltransferase [Candidatus Sumerlaeota bacterium]